MTRRVGIVGASGFTGAELLRLLAGHPDLEVVIATGDSMAGTAAGELYPSLAGAYPGLSFVAYEPALADEHELDVVFCGLPELFREELRTAKLIATPGCYVTTATLALAPLLAAGAVEPTGIVVDAASGVSGAGRPPKANTTFCAVDEDFTAYGVLTHRHTPEIEQNLSHAAGTTAQVLFTPHLAPMNRGILATCYARPTAPTTTEALRQVLHDAYDHEPFVVVRDDPPSTKATLGSQMVHVTAYADDRTGWVVAIAALDNLTKGASGGAIQAANLALGLDETAGLPVAGLYP